jgi:hypothetical protein
MGVTVRQRRLQCAIGKFTQTESGFISVTVSDGDTAIIVNGSCDASAAVTRHHHDVSVVVTVSQ